MVQLTAWMANSTNPDTERIRSLDAFIKATTLIILDRKFVASSSL
jgi:hypothetical protein